jgi:hypothetical protein
VTAAAPEASAPRRDPGPARVTTGPPPRLAVLRIGALGGLVGMMCCVGPATLAAAGIVGAATAARWAGALYGGYAWWFRGAGVLTITALVAVSLRRQRCSLRGLRSARSALLRLVAVAVTTYAVLDGATTALGHLAGGR